MDSYNCHEFGLGFELFDVWKKNFFLFNWISGAIIRADYLFQCEQNCEGKEPYSELLFTQADNVLININTYIYMYGNRILKSESSSGSKCCFNT